MKKIGCLFVSLLVLSFMSGVYAYESVTVTKNGSVAGEWTQDIDAARALAKTNGVPVYVNWGSKFGCAVCIQTYYSVYSQKKFIDWAKSNGIPLVDADYSDCPMGGGTTRVCTTPSAAFIIKEFVYSPLRLGTSFPTGFVFDENGGKSSLYSKNGESLITSFSPASSTNGFMIGQSSLYSGDFVGRLANHSFISVFDSILNYRDDSVNNSVNIYFSNDTKITRLYNLYGNNSLNVHLYYSQGTRMFKYADLIDWYQFSNLSVGNKYFIRAINVTDLKNSGVVFFYSGLDNAKNNISFKEMTLNEFRNGYKFTATGSQDVYMKVWRMDPVPEAVVAKNGSERYYGSINTDTNSSVVRGIIAKYYNITKSGYYFFPRVEYNLEYYQGEKEDKIEVVTEVLEIEKPSGNVVSQSIYDFANLFSSWFGSSEKLNISYSGAVAGEWTTDYDSAKELSIVNNRPMILLFGKSLNEKYSTEVINKVLKSEAWREYAKAKGIPLVFVDFSNSSSLSQEAIRLYPTSSLGSIVKLPTLLYFNSNQELLGVCIYRKGLNCNSIKNSVNVTNFVEVLESYTGEIYDLGASEAEDCADGSCSVDSENSFMNGFNWLIMGSVNKTGVVYWVIDGKAPAVNRNYTFVNVSTSLAVAGEWTTNLTAARALAKQNGVFYFALVTSQTCTYCNQYASRIIATDAFKNWAKTNGIPLLYADAWKEESKANYQAFVNLGYNNFISSSGINNIGSNTIPIVYLIDGAGNSTSLVKVFHPHSAWMSATGSYLTDAELNQKSAVARHLESIKIYVEKYYALSNISPVSNNTSSGGFNINWILDGNTTSAMRDYLSYVWVVGGTFEGEKRNALGFNEYNIPVMQSGAVAGKWTTDLVAARALAKQNGVFFIAHITKSQCSYCMKLVHNVFSTEVFKNWATKNGIPLVYANADIGTSEPYLTIRGLYFKNGDSTGLPINYFIDGSGDGKILIKKKSNPAGSTYIDFNKIPEKSYVEKYLSDLRRYVGNYTSVSDLENENIFRENMTSNINWTVPTLAGSVATSISGASVNDVIVGGYPIATSGAAAGEWTSDFAAAKELAIRTNKFIIFDFGTVHGCRPCEDLNYFIYKKNSFRQWAKQNGIPLVYANYQQDGNNSNFYAIKKEVLPSASSLSFPTIVVVGGNDGKMVYGSFLAFVNKTYNNVTLDPFGPEKFVEVIHSYIR